MSTRGDGSTRQSRNELFKCEICIETFSSKLTLMRHERSHRTIARCERREKQITSEHNSTRQSENNSFQCEICIETFPSKSTLARHERSHRATARRERSKKQITSKHYSTQLSENKSLECKVYIEKFPSKLTLMRHKQSHCGVGSFLSQHHSPILQDCPQPSLILGKSDDSNNALESTNQRDDSTEKGYGHSQIGKQFKGEQLKMHQENKRDASNAERPHDEEGWSSPWHHSIVFQKNSEPLYMPEKSDDSRNGSESDSTHQIEDSTEKSYEYDTSRKRFKDAQQRKMHQYDISEKLFECKTCPEKFQSKLNLMQHKRSHGRQGSSLPEHHSPILQNNPRPSHIPGESDDSNNTSELESTNQSDEQLKLHRYDKSKKRFKCKTSRKMFSVKASLKSHKRLQTVKKSFRCELCCGVFTNLKAHRRVHTGEKPFACSLCDKSFSDLSTMKRHRRVHTKEKPFTCDVCSNAFTRRDTLTIHMRKHTLQNQISKEYTFVCEVCEERFRFSTHLAKHLLIHAGE